jgi:hypothetical protein
VYGWRKMGSLAANYEMVGSRSLVPQEVLQTLH